MWYILKISLEQFKQLKINCSVEWTKLIFEDFEASKLSLNPDDTATPTTLVFHEKICTEIKQLTGKSMEQLVRNYNDKNVEWDGEESEPILHFTAMENLFKPVLNDINFLINKVLAKETCKHVNSVVLVGGFAESTLLFRNVENLFPKSTSLLAVKKSSTPVYSVVKGAVLYGQYENIIKPILQRAMTVGGNPPPPATQNIAST